MGSRQSIECHQSRCTSHGAGYDGWNRETKRIEKENGAIIQHRQFVWDGWRRSEEPDADNATKLFYAQGEQISGTSYFVTRDHLGSIRELSADLGALHPRYDYDPYGVHTKPSGDLDGDFAFTDYYVSHEYSDVAVATRRVYRANLGRWMSRDPIED
jgi:RHS repeat-associated protein